MKRILKVALPVPIDRPFDYLIPEDEQTPEPGTRVRVPFGSSTKIGVILGLEQESKVPPSRLRAAIEILDRTPLLNAQTLKLIDWASRYYHHPIGECIQATLAPALRRGQSTTRPVETRLFPTSPARAEMITRAPLQSELLSMLHATPAGMTREALRNNRPTLTVAARSLVKKGLAEWRQTEALESVAMGARPFQSGPPLHPEQIHAVQQVEQGLGRFGVFLLEGVTGSGKTEVYLQLALSILERGQQVMLLLPEINLTPQLRSRVSDRLGRDPALFHSAMSDSERQSAWLAFQRGEAPILLGTRSAAFIPDQRLGLIILDEEHDSSFKQQEGFRFSARDVAVMRAQQQNLPIVLGSATPSLESLHNVMAGRYTRLTLSTRAGKAKPPVIQVLDTRAQKLDEGLSSQLVGLIRATLERGEQTLLFVNRRGFSPRLICHVCGWVAPCRYCESHLVLHEKEEKLCCHHCGFTQRKFVACPECGGQDLKPLGLGTERVESALRRLFPQKRIARIDRDTMQKKDALTQIFRAVREGRIDIMIGTQMLAKGHDFPAVTLVGIIDLDAGLYSTDFRASEKTAQLIVQVAGRAGRASRPGHVLLQTRHPDHPLVLELRSGSYKRWAEQLLSERQALELPPYSHQAMIRAESSRADHAEQLLLALKQVVEDHGRKGTIALGPAPAPLQKKGNRFRFQLLLQSAKRGALHVTLAALMTHLELAKPSRTTKWSVDVDPSDLS